MSINFKLKKAKEAFDVVENEILKALPVKKLAGYKTEKGLKKFVAYQVVNLEFDLDCNIMIEYITDVAVRLFVTYQGFNFKIEIYYK